MTQTNPKKRQALKYASRGWAVVPLHAVKDGKCSCERGGSCQRPGKHPRTSHGIKDASTDRNQVGTWWKQWPDSNIGIATGISSGIFVLDVDGKSGRASLKVLQEKHGPLPKTVTVKTGRGRHLYFRCDGAQVGNSASRIAQGIDIRGDGGYVVGPGSVHASGAVYRFVDGRALPETAVASAPGWLNTLISKPNIEAEAQLIPIPAAKLERARAYANAARDRELERLRKAPRHQRNDTLNLAAFKLGQLAAYDILKESEIEVELARVAREIGLDADEVDPTISSGLKAGRQHPRPLPFSRSSTRVKKVEPTEKPDKLATELASLGETDSDNAQRFARRFGAEVIYTPGRGWLVFDGKRWQPDVLLQVTELAKETARRIADEARHLDQDDARAARRRFASQSLAKGSLDRMLDLAKSLLAVEDKQLDADPWLLNVENGTIDLRTGRREKHDPRGLLTKIAPVRANRRAKCPKFKKFLKRVTGDDRDLSAFIQKAVGYSLTGETKDQVFFFVFGESGSNGKSTLVNSLRDMLGDYGCHTLIETLLVKQYDNNIPADLARLNGARMVTAIEANFNRHLDEAKIKAMTGGEPIVARFMRHNFFQFMPEFKLWMVANDRPRVRGTDSAFWRRVRVIPLTVKIPLSERDPDLSNKLRAEWPGILAWAVRGCRRWQTEGLKQPAAVRSATKAWHQESDHLKRFVSSETIISPGAKIPASRLYDLYTKWCAKNGERTLPVQGFKARLQESQDITHARVKGCSWWRGIRLRG